MQALFFGLTHFNHVGEIKMQDTVYVGKKNFRWDRQGEIDHQKVDGSYIKLTVWRGRCIKCKQPFDIRVAAHIEDPKQNSGFNLRRCKPHRDKDRAATGMMGFRAFIERNGAKITP